MRQGKCTVSSKEEYVLVSFSHPTADMKETLMAVGSSLQVPASSRPGQDAHI